MTTLVARPAVRGLRGSITVPGDKSVSHRALLLAALAEGTSTLRGLSAGDDVARTAAAMAACGVGLEPSGPGELTVEGGVARLHEPAGVQDVGNSGTSIRLLAGWSAARPWLSVLQGDSSIARRPMGRVAEPLRRMGAIVDGRERGTLPPLVVRGGDLTGIEHRPEVASAQVKGAVLLAGLGADGETVVHEAVPTRRHTEELIERFAGEIEHRPGWARVRRSTLRPVDLAVPADPSQAAFWVVAASLVPGSDLRIAGVYVGAGRAGFLDVLARMGAEVTVEAEHPDEHTADLRVRSARLSATTVAGEEVPSLIDEIPVLAVAAAFAEGTTTFSDASELRVKESDRVESTVAALRALGAGAEGRADGLVVEGGRLAGGLVDAAGDHRIAMASAVAGLASSQGATVEGWEAVATSYPGFAEELARCW
ncbi:MAG: 3-phosphoshikimate 1-carboxyvinyltransferase [Actinomycetota bacterium]|nr:3-phosphoshikimate 1-carboxyvinyltransferase [Actinomycetota bacterium]